MPLPIMLFGSGERSWLDQALRCPFSLEAGAIAAIGIVSLVLAHLVRK